VDDLSAQQHLDVIVLIKDIAAREGDPPVGRTEGFRRAGTAAEADIPDVFFAVAAELERELGQDGPVHKGRGRLVVDPVGGGADLYLE